MTPIHTITPSDDVEVVYEPLDELTQEEMERIIRLARKVKCGDSDLLTISRDRKNNRLYIKPYKSAA